MWIKCALANDHADNRMVRVNMDNIVNYLPSASNADFTVLEDVNGREIEVQMTCQKIDEMLMVAVPKETVNKW